MMKIRSEMMAILNSCYQKPLEWSLSNWNEGRSIKHGPSGLFVHVSKRFYSSPSFVCHTQPEYVSSPGVSAAFLNWRERRAFRRARRYIDNAIRRENQRRQLLNDQTVLRQAAKHFEEPLATAVRAAAEKGEEDDVHIH